MISDNIEKIYNDGERMIPFVSHTQDELTRHFSSHNFFKNIILKDIDKLNLKNLSILDVGFGTGYASYLYSKIDAVVSVSGVDVSEECLEWAKSNFYNKKINYKICDAAKFLKKSGTYSYIVTRHVLEHIENGLNIVDENKFSNRLCINVPYDERVGNRFHILTGIKEKDFSKYKNVEFFYEDLNGITYDKLPDGIFINSIICVASKRNMPKVRDVIDFPFKASSPEEIIDELGSDNLKMFTNIIYMQKEYINRYKSDIVALESMIKDRDISIDQKDREITNISNSLRGVYGSKAWKMTLPIRKMAIFIRKIKG